MAQQQPAEYTSVPQVQAIKANDETAIRQLYLSNYARVEKFVLNNNGSVEQAKDIYQEAFIAVWRNIQLDRFQPQNDTALDGYLYQISKNKWIDHLRSGHYTKVVRMEKTNLPEEQASTHSLLEKYTLSYHYSLALAGQSNNPADLADNFIAFAPGFLDEDKKRYLASVKDSFQLDRTYLTMLPQPFTIDFVNRINSLFKGETYINSASTASSFINHAGRHKIIHIGTHAESNNLYPEFSRLIFSKGASSGSNSVFLYNLYNCDLRSELAVLTACESGKPGYQDGEGMISMAHAFNYAGSGSMLTGLWKIDEKASTLLMDAFYKNLVKGMPKDEALKQAKLHYLATAKGRMLSPQYWAGLVIMGDTSAITIRKTNISMWWWIAGITLLPAVIAFILYRKKAAHK